jgi:hypothetical protein
MSITKAKIAGNLRQVRQDIAEACERSGRAVDAVQVLPVTKSVGLDEIRHLLELGLRDFGESRAQQLTRRAAEVEGYLQRRRNPLKGQVRWHMIGHLQRNKVKHVLQVVRSVHSVDSLRLAEELSARAAKLDREVDVFLEVNCSGEEQKHGVAVAAALHLAELLCTLGRLRLRGLMTMAPFVDDPEQARPTFVRLRELFEEIRKEGIGGETFTELSMGMSNDYVQAVEEGATICRIGTSLFE